MTRELGPGDRLGPYRILDRLGRGGMGAVYRAREDASGRVLALKVLPGSLGEDERFVRRFDREARASASVSHPNVATVHAAGEADGVRFLALELLPGGSLRDRLRTRGVLAPREAAALGAEVAHGLGAIHAAGLVHRDVKPENVLFDEEGRAKVADFGLVRRDPAVIASATGSLTPSGEIVGTFAYLAPEQADARGTVNAEADLYGLGAVLYEAIAGRPPFEGSGLGLLKHHLLDAPVPPGTLVPGLPPRLERLVLTLLAKAPGARGTAEGAARELDAIARGEEEPRRRGRGGFAVALVLVLGGAAALAATQATRGTPEATPGSRAPATPPPPAPAPTPGAPVPAERSGFPSTRCTRLRAVLEIGAPPGVDASAFPRHENGSPATSVRALAVSKDGARAFAADGFGRVVVWDLARELPVGEPLSSGIGPGTGIGALALSSDARTLLVGSDDHAVRRWDLGTRAVLGTLPAHDHGVTGVFFWPDDAHALTAGGGDKTIRFWDLAIGAQTRRPIEHWSWIRATAPGPRGIVIGDESGFPSLADPAGSDVARNLCKTERSVHALALSPEGDRVLIGAANGKVHLTRVDGTRTAEHPSYPAGTAVVAVAFSLDGLLALSAGDDGTIVLHDVPPKGVMSGRLVERDRLDLRSRGDSARTLAFLPDGKGFLAGTDRGLLLRFELRAR